MTLRRLLVLAVCLLGAIACGEEGRDDGAVTVAALELPADVGELQPPTRFWRPVSGPERGSVAEEVVDLAESFEPQRVLRRQALLDLHPRQARDLDAFAFDPRPARVETAAAGVHIVWEQRTDLCITLPVDFPAARASAIEVEIAGLRGRPLDLRWRTQTEEGGVSGMLTVHAAQPLTLAAAEALDEEMQRYRFALQGLEAWRGQVIALGLCNSEWIEALWLRRLTAWEERVDGDEVEALRGRPLRVDLDNDVRDALLVTPTSPVTHPIADAQGARLELRTAVAVLPGSPALRFRAQAGERVLWTEEVRVEDGWREVRIPLEAGRGGGEVRLEVDLVRAGGDLAAGFWQVPTLLRETDEPPLNLILISVDTLRADHLSLYGYARATSPHLDRWAEQRAVVFERAVAASPWTLPSHTTMFTGLDAHRHGVNLVTERVPPGLPLLAARLRQAGYHTRAITGGGYLHPQFGLARGFEAYRYWGDRRSVSSRHELETHRQLLYRWLRDQADRPFFLFFHTYAVHGPLSAHEPYYQQFGGQLHPNALRIETPPPVAQDGYRQRMTASIQGPEGHELLGPEDLSPFYDSGIAYTDQVLGQLFAVLDALDLSRRTAVLLTSDHGEMLGEYGVYDHHYLYDENLRVPFVLALPEARFLPAGSALPSRWLAGRASDRRVAAQVRNADVAPTLLELAGLTAEGELDGRSVLTLLRGEVETLPPAWSYAANSNYGLALQDGRNKVIERASVWPDRDAGVGREDERQADAETARRLRRQAQRGFQRDASGYRLRLQNPRAAAGRVLRGQLRLTPTPPVSALKSTDLPAACRQADTPCLQDADEPVQRFHVPVESRYTLLVETGLSEAAIRAAWEGDGALHEARVELESVESFVALRFDAGGWQRLDRMLLPEEAGILLWWDGPAGSRGRVDGVGAELPAELQQQLRALGYLQ